MPNLFDSTTRRMALPEQLAEAEVTVTVVDADIVDAEDCEPELEELEVTRETLRLDDDETRRASPELVDRVLARAERDPADELEFDRELELPPPEVPALVVDTIATLAPSLDDLLDDALQKCLARQVSEATLTAVEPPAICEAPPSIRPRSDRSEVRRTRRLLWSALAVVGGTLLGVALAVALLQILG